MAYASYSDYLNTYRGSRLTQEQFDCYVEEAGAYLELLTYGRCSEVTGGSNLLAVTNACCAVTEELERQQSQPEVVKHSLGQWSRSYAKEQNRERKVADKARLYLRGTGLLWRGWRWKNGNG